jgi:hypothetical protein
VCIYTRASQCTDAGRALKKITNWDSVNVTCRGFVSPGTGPGWLSRYSDWTVAYEDRTPVGGRAWVPRGRLYNGYRGGGGLLPGGKAAGA